MNATATLLPDRPAGPSPTLLRALGGVWRLTYPGFCGTRRLLVLAGLSGLLYALTTQVVGHNRDSGFLSWTILVHFRILIPAVALLSSAGAIRDDMQSVPVDYVLTRPVRRPIFVLFRYLSHMVCLQVSCLAPLAALVAAGYSRGIPTIEAMLVPLLMAQALMVAGFSALGFLFGTLSSRYFIIAVLYGFIVEIGVGQIPTQVAKLSMSSHILAMLETLLGRVSAGADLVGVPGAAGAILLFIAIALSGAVALFSLREFTGSGTAEK